MSWWDSLRRRKVVQWGVVYVAAAWGFLQGMQSVSDAFHWPFENRSREADDAFFVDGIRDDVLTQTVSCVQDHRPTRARGGGRPLTTKVIVSSGPCPLPY
jgi:hypothetical protein